jgi:deoxyribonuclease V
VIVTCAPSRGAASRRSSPAGQADNAVVIIGMPEAWPVTEAEAVAEQDRLRGAVMTSGTLAGAGLVAGLDVAYAKGSDELAAAAVVLDVSTLAAVESQAVTGVARFPYIPGLLAFREIPALADALGRLGAVPDVLVCDGYGIAHPRRFGLASHLGVLTGRPSIGVAKTPFTGHYDEPGTDRGSSADLIDGGEVVGRVLRTQRGVKPVFVSVGHAVGLDEACDLVLRLSPRYRLPETTRAADHLARAELAGHLSGRRVPSTGSPGRRAGPAPRRC